MYEVYRKHAPHQLARLGEILEKYRGNESALYHAMRSKYERTQSDRARGMADVRSASGPSAAAGRVSPASGPSVAAGTALGTGPAGDPSVAVGEGPMDSGMFTSGPSTAVGRPERSHRTQPTNREHTARFVFGFQQESSLGARPLPPPATPSTSASLQAAARPSSSRATARCRSRTPRRPTVAPGSAFCRRCHQRGHWGNECPSGT